MINKRILLFNGEVTTNFNHNDYSSKWLDEESGVEYYSYYEANKTETIKEFVEFELKNLKYWHDIFFICYEMSQNKTKNKIQEIFKNEMGSFNVDFGMGACNVDFASYDGGFILEKIANWSNDKESLLYFINTNGKRLYKAIQLKIPLLNINLN
jgi:hypothetical protein